MSLENIWSQEYNRGFKRIKSWTHPLLLLVYDCAVLLKTFVIILFLLFFFGGLGGGRERMLHAVQSCNWTQYWLHARHCQPNSKKLFSSFVKKYYAKCPPERQKYRMQSEQRIFLDYTLLLAWPLKWKVCRIPFSLSHLISLTQNQTNTKLFFSFHASLERSCCW